MIDETVFRAQLLANAEVLLDSYLKSAEHNRYVASLTRAGRKAGFTRRAKNYDKKVEQLRLHIAQLKEGR